MADEKDSECACYQSIGFMSYESLYGFSRLTAIKIKDGSQQCKINYHDFQVFSCPVSMGTLLKITIVSISAPGKVLILNHLLSGKF